MRAFLSEQLQADRVGSWFKRDYPQSKQQFAQAIEALKIYSCAQYSWPLASAPELSTDSVWIGSQSAEHVIVMISGTHGVEGYCGSAVQRFILTCLTQQTIKPPDNVAILMVHALNPWGMHWARRCDQQGIDLNRNFIDFNCVPEVSPEYHELLSCFAITDRQTRFDTLNTKVAAWGREKFDRIYSGGQYQYEWAPFFGGRAPAHANGVIEALIDYWQLQQRCLVVLDLHSGLGPWAFGELISDHKHGSTGNQFAQQLFGPAVAITDQGQSFSVIKQGLLDYRWHQLMKDRGCFLTLEFGTGGTDTLFDVLLADHLLWRDWNTATADSPDYLQQRAAMLAHFCPDNSLWQQAVLFKAWQVVERALKVVEW